MDRLLDELIRHDIDQICELNRKARSDEYEVCVWGCGTLGKGWVRQILTHLGISVNYYCDNDSSLYGSVICDEIRVKPFEYLRKNTKRTVCFLALGSVALPEVYVQLREQGIENIVTYDDLLLLNCGKELNFKFWNKRSIAIYTCITGGYDNLREPELLIDGCDYFFISEHPPESDSVYRWIDVNNFVPSDIKDDRLKNRYCKINAHKIFPEYKYSIYMDGYLTMKEDLTLIIDKLGKSGLAVLSYREWESVYTEAIRCIQGHLEHADPILEQIEKYWLEGMPNDFPTILCGVLIRQHNNPHCVKIMEDWWKEIISTGSRRDQISLPYVLWRNDYSISDIIPVVDNPYDLWDHFNYTGKHNKSRS